MISYELAKELKEAGYPQGCGSYYIADGRHAGGSAKEVEFMLDTFEANDTARHTFAYSPTLSELIEACGKIRFRLQRMRDGTWVCDDRDGVVESFGPTPEQAVARLWLVLKRP